MKKKIARKNLEVARMENSDLVGPTATEVRPDAVGYDPLRKLWHG